MTTCTLRGFTALDDGELAALSIDGQGEAFAELYDRHEQRVYGFCLRMLGSPHDAADATQETFVRLLRRLPGLAGREPNFVAYLLTTARHACYDMIAARRRVEPMADAPEPAKLGPGALEEDPERAALLAATREQVEAANAALPARQREVLALREVECLSYDQIAAIMELKSNAVAQLLSRARIRLRDALRGSALASIEAASPDCDRALPLIAPRQDGERSAELDWLKSHLSACVTCRTREAAMQEAGASYRLLIPAVPLIWLRQASIARAAEELGAAWSEVASAGAGGRASAGAGAQSTRRADQADVSALDERGPRTGTAPASLKWLTSGRSRETTLAIAAFLAVLLLLTGSLGDHLLASSAPASATAPSRSTQFIPRDHPSGRYLRPHRVVRQAVAGQPGATSSGGGSTAASGSGLGSGGGAVVRHPSATSPNPVSGGGITNPTSSGSTHHPGTGSSSSRLDSSGTGSTPPGSGGSTPPGSGAGGTPPGGGCTPGPGPPCP